MSSSDNSAPNLNVVTKEQTNTIPRMVEFLISSALNANASDIHMGVNNHPSAKEKFLVRFRVAGRLVPMKTQFINEKYKEVVSRIKILANLDITQVGTPQDGQVTMSSKEGEDDIILRVGIIPNGEFEEVCIRIQRKTEKDIEFDDLLMTSGMKNTIKDLIQRQNGMIILNGPAGSGKTTSIYAMLGVLAGPNKKVITAEDPVEKRLPWVNHVQVNQRQGFADLAKCFMRHDADIIFIGEIRDEESAKTAIQLAQTGHLVLTTLHTRDSIGVVQRLRAFDIASNFIADSLICSLAQRLTVGLCPHCKVPYKPPEKLRDIVYRIMPPPEDYQMYKEGEGCDSCIRVVHGQETMQGITGLIPIFEMLTVEPVIRDLINNEASTEEIRRNCRQSGMRTLAEESLIRVYKGLISLENVYGKLFGANG